MRKGESVRAQEDGFMLAAENLIDPKQSELMIGWCAGVLDTGSLGTAESSMAKVAVSEALMRAGGRFVR
jgi:acyl-CoA dehydrogenase